MTVVLHVRDSRRLTGPTRFWDLPSAILDIGAPTHDVSGDTDRAELYFECPAQHLIARWEVWAQRALEAVGWSEERLLAREFADGVSLLISAPIDSLYAATEVNEFAFKAALADLLRGRLPDVEENAARLRQVIDEERNPPLLALQALAKDHGLLFLSDDDDASIGGGTGSLTFAVDTLPPPDQLLLAGLHNIKVAAVSGTNGKSTTVRLLSAMVQASTVGDHQAVSGVTSTDWIRVGDEILDEGDYSGPGGARTVMRDQRVDIALLEAARGGLNRRGLGVPRLDVATLTNISNDHLGEHGSSSLDDLLDVKWTIARVAQHVVLNADDPLLATRGQAEFVPGSQKATWFSLEPNNRLIQQHVIHGGSALLADGSDLLAVTGRHREVLAQIADIPITLGGGARHNVANALAAAATARALGLTTSDIESGLRTFGTHPDDNPGRLTMFNFGSGPDQVRLLVDFAHNPEGFTQLMKVAESLTPRRLLISLGQAGDRSNEEIEQLADSAWGIRPQRILIKDLDSYRRGRQEGEVPELIEKRLLSIGANYDQLQHTANEMDTVIKALEWSRAGDLLVLVVHSERDAVISALSRLERRGWTAGSPIPPEFVGG